MVTKKFRVNPHYQGVWSSSYKQTDGTTGYGKYAIVHDSDKKMAAYMSLVEANTAALTDSSWMVFSDINSLTSYIDAQITAHTQDLIKEQVNVSITLSGGGPGWGSTPPTITIYDQNNVVLDSKTAVAGAAVTFQVLPRTVYRVTSSAVTTYKRPKEYFYTALSNNIRNITLEYKYISAGVCIELTDHTLVDTTDFNSTSMTANGVYVSDGTNVFIVALKEGSSSAQWVQNYSDAVPYITTAADSTTANADFGGEANQSAANTFLAGQSSGSTVKMPAFTVAKNYVFPDGISGYLPACGELFLLITNFDAVNTAILAAGGVALQKSTWYWSSTQNDASYAWGVNSSPSMGVNYGGNNYCVRPVSAF